MKCDTCGAKATIHVTELLPDNVHVMKHLCNACADKMKLPIETDITSAIQKLRRLLAFIKANSRMPSLDESAPFGGTGDRTPPTPGTKEFREQVSHLEALANFMEQHGRPPTGEELPDPF